MAQIDFQCDECQRMIKANVGQSSIDVELRWYLSYKCSYCTSSMEMDDIGFPPQNIRNAILTQEGEWELIIDKTSLNAKVKTLKVLRKVLNLSIQKAFELTKDFPYITSGTKAEMAWLKKLLWNENVKSLVKEKY